MNDEVAVRLEALKLVREWSAGLTVVQTGAVAVLGALLKETPSGLFLLLIVAFLLALLISIWFGVIAVSGTVPSIVQRLPTHPTCDIYAQKGGIGRFTLGKQCLLQERFFVLSLILFAVVLVIRPSQETESKTIVIKAAHIEGPVGQAGKAPLK